MKLITDQCEAFINWTLASEVYRLTRPQKRFLNLLLEKKQNNEPISNQQWKSFYQFMQKYYDLYIINDQLFNDV